MANSAFTINVQDSTRRSITQASHGFTIGDCLYYTGSTWAKAKADTENTADCLGIVSYVTDANTFTINTEGYISGLTGLTAGTVYFLSSTTAGALTSTEPTADYYVSKPMLVAISTTTGVVLHYRGKIQSSAGTSSVGTPATIVPCGRLTPTTATPILTSESLDFTTIYYTPFIGNQIPISDGSSFIFTTFSELSLALDSDSGHTGYHQSGKNFDLFVFNDSGTIRLGTGPAWTNDTTRADAITRVNGYRVNNATITIRFGSASGNTVSVPANKATLVGYMRASSNGQCTCRLGGSTSQTGGKWFLVNEYNPVKFSLFVHDDTNNWSYAVSTWRQSNAATGNKVEFLSCESNPALSARVVSMTYSSTASDTGFCGVGVDSTSVNSAKFLTESGGVATNQAAAIAEYAGRVAGGYHYLAWIEYRRQGTVFFIGDNGVTGVEQTGLTAEIFA